ncbi:MAG TPA: hypothetical protein VK179_00335 [Bacteroidales bacterium]|nr:hypothetical protein [Bacteroidales bacterium]
MKFRSLLYLLAVLLLVIDGCRKNSDIEEQRYLWSTEAPLTIPYRLRIQRFEKGNLLRNPSFETGKLYKLDSLKTSFAIDGWQQTGEHVYWVDTLADSLFSEDEAFSGYRAVKIERTSALETDLQGEGILSDYIKVIPGNYSLSLYARMQHIIPNRARLGIKMFDCVDISVRYYDRNKNLIKPAIKYPHENQVIDGSFKSLSLANFTSVENLDWCRITGKSHSFPFPDGDIPTDAHFVKIFIGLKGTGTLWIDSVTFRYTDKNFSVGERMIHYTDTAFHIRDMVLPTPKKVSRLESVIFSKPGMNPYEQPVIVYADASLKEEAGILKKALTVNTLDKNQEINVITENVSPEQLKMSKLIISIGKTALYNRFISKLPTQEIKGKKEGYYIYSPPESPNIIILGANSEAGLNYAVSTAVQLIDKTRPIFHNARIIDYPDFTGRYFTFEPGYSGRSVAEQYQFKTDLTRYKMNGAITLDSSDAGMVKSTDPFFFSYTVSRYMPPVFPDVSHVAPHGDSIGHTPLHKDGYIYPDILSTEVVELFNPHLQYFIPGMKFYTGSSFFSINTDLADLNRYRLIFRWKPAFFDNSMLMATSWAEYNGTDPYFPGKARLFNLFEPYGNIDIEALYKNIDTSAFVVNLPPASEIEVIRLATAADFLWNMNSYSKDYSLWKVLVSRYGRQTAVNLITYADKYSVLLETLLKIENNIQSAKNIKQGQITITELTSVTAQISDALGQQHRLIQELLRLNAELRNRLNKSSLRGAR